jgi:hypothetical protein
VGDCIVLWCRLLYSVVVWVTVMCYGVGDCAVL